MPEMIEHSPNPYMEDDEISLKELILKLQEYFWEVVRSWKLVTLVTILFIGFMLYRAFTAPIIYPATLTFMVNDNENSGVSGVAAILGQFGLGGGGGGGKYNINKILELSHSRRIVQMALFEKTSIEGKNDFVANHIIREYKFHERWLKDETGLKDLVFDHDSIEIFSSPENRALKILHTHVGKKNIKGIMDTSYEENTGIINITTTSTNEQLSIALTKKIYEKVREFYVNKTIERQKRMYKLVKSKTDSLQIALNSVQYKLLRFDDSHKAINLRQYGAERVRLQQEAQKLIASYAESYKNQEITDFALKNKTPFVQLIDAPIQPIDGVGKSKFKSLIIGMLLGGFLSIAFVIIRKIIRDILND